MNYILRKKYNSKQSGQVVITAVVFFLLIATTVGTGVMNPVLRQVNQANDFIRTRASLFASQAVNEDALYRIKNNKKFSSPSTLTLNGYSATATSTSVAGGLQIDSSGGAFSLVRNIQTHLTSGSGTSFNYGVQAGEGGLILENSSSVSGNVYSNGPVIGSTNVNTGNVSNPPLVGSVSVGNIASSLGALDFAFHPTEPYAYILSSAGIEVVQLTNLSSPTVIKTISGGYSSNPYFTFITVSGNYLYVSGINSNSVDVWSIASAANPVKVKQVPLGSSKNAYTLTVVGNYLYAPLTGSSMAIIDIANPPSAALVNTITTPLDPTRVVLVGNYAYLFSGDGNYSKITVYSLASPTNPTVVKTLAGAVNNSVRDPSYQQGSFLYGLSRGLSNIHILNVSDPANPTLAYIQSYNSTFAGSMWGFGGYLYIPIDHRYSKSIEVWSISGGAPPVKVSTLNNVPGGTGSYWRTEVRNGYLYYLNGVNNATGSSLGIYRISGGTGGNTVSGDVVSAGPLVEVANNSAVNNPINPPLVGTMPVGWAANPPVDIAVSGTYAYLLCDSTFMVVDITNKASPNIVKTVTTSIVGNHSHSSIAVSGNYLYITQLNDYVLSIYDITNPLDPVLLPAVNLGAQGGYPKTVTVSGGYAYVTRYTNSGPAIQIINVSNPASAVLVKTMTVPNWPRWITISGGYMYVTFDQGGTANMQIYSLTDPANPTLVYSMPSNIMLGGHAREYIAGNYMYVDAGDNGRLHVADITNKASPIVKFDSPYNIISRPTRMDGAAGYLYISENAYTGNTATPRFQVWSTANPILPVLKNTVSIPPIPWGIVGLVAKNDYLYILDSGYNTTGNLRIYRIGSDAPSFVSTGRIEKINASGSLYANNIVNSVAGKDAYFKNISGTTIERNAYPNSSDQPTTSMPISDALISQWEAEAVAGGVITTPCPYKITGSEVVTLGPVKIDCDLEVSNSSTLYLSGMVWVKGNVYLSNTGNIAISPSISGKTAAIIADDPDNRSSGSQINLSNNTTYSGSGANSYVMLLSQNNSAKNGGSNTAINVANSVSGKLLVYSPYGEILLQNNVSIKEVTAWRIRLINSAQVIYETGLANLLFTSGPAGGYTFDRWREVQ